MLIAQKNCSKKLHLKNCSKKKSFVYLVFPMPYKEINQQEKTSADFDNLNFYYATKTFYPTSINNFVTLKNN